jgi:Protein of unknown function (DUF2971)
MPGNLPPKLYKYQPYNVQTLDNLQNRKIWFSKTASFNDPFDGSTGYNIKRVTATNWQALAEHWREGPSWGRPDFDKIYLTNGKPNAAFKAILMESFIQARQSVMDRLKEIGVACFSESVDDFLMWSHYADGHRGFCLEFDTRYPPFQWAQQVQYSDFYPLVDIAALLFEGDKYDPGPLLITKSRHWSYEKEWRTLHEEGNIEFEIDVAALTGIYFGCSIPDVHKQTILLLLSGSSTKVHAMKRSETQFRLTPINSDYPPSDYLKGGPQ